MEKNPIILIVLAIITALSLYYVVMHRWLKIKSKKTTTFKPSKKKK